MGKGEIARYEQFLLFPQCFQKACFPGASKGVIMWEWVKPFTKWQISALSKLKAFADDKFNVMVQFPLDRKDNIVDTCIFFCFQQSLQKASFSWSLKVGKSISSIITALWRSGEVFLWWVKFKQQKHPRFSWKNTRVRNEAKICAGEKNY